MKRLAFAMVIAVLAACTTAPVPNKADVLQSPDGRLEAQFLIYPDGSPAYALTFDGKDVIKPSKRTLSE